MSMGPSDRIEKAVSLEEGVEHEDLAKAQWSLIRALEAEYHGKTVYGTKCRFEDRIWSGRDGGSDGGQVNWKTALATNSHAQTILVKIVCFELMITNRLEIRSLMTKSNIQRHSIIELIERKGLLAGDSDEYLLGLSHITDDDLLAMLDALLVRASSESYYISYCSEVSQFIIIANLLAESTPLFEIRARLPWKMAGLSINAWAKRRAADIGEVFQKSDGFAPLVPETAMPLIERSLHLVIDHRDHFIELGRCLRGYEYGKKQSGPSAEQLLAKYGSILGDVVARPDISKYGDQIGKRSAVFAWIRQLVYLARGACVNIIALTSGLRNHDIRSLPVGACKPSGRVDMLFYLRAKIRKTKNIVIVPVPPQAHDAVKLLEQLKFTGSGYLIDGKRFSKKTYDPTMLDKDVRLATHDSLNEMIRDFAEHFNIPFLDPRTGQSYSAHNYRTTVASWLGAHSNLSVLLVRRLFGHTNDVMPTVYLRNNPSFIRARQEEKASAAAETARQMALAASQGRLAGVKGDQLLLGYKEHVSRYESAPKKSHSLTDVELVLSFSKIIEHRILNESVCGFLTPFGVRCMRNPADSSQPPCARRSRRDKTREIPEEILRHINDIDPQNCIGTSCDQSMVGPWSEPLKESLLWYAGILRHQMGDRFTDEDFREHAVQFIRQYGPPIKKVFHIEVLANGSVNCQEGTGEGSNA